MNQISSIGFDAVHQSNFRYDIPEGLETYLLVITTTPAIFHINETIEEYPAHTAVLFPPKQKIWYGAIKEHYSNHWLMVESDESFITNFPQQGLPFAVSDPEYCHSLFQLLTWEDSQDTVSQLLRILFNKLHDDVTSTEPLSHDHELLALRRKIAASPELPWNITDMAQELHLSTGYLQFLYKQKYDISCMDDVINFRLLKARDYLIYTPHSIAEIAELCGYNNTEHFCRQFHKYVGITPGQYRKQSNSSSVTT